MRFAFIDQHEGNFEIARMCDVFEVSRSGFYAWKNRVPSSRTVRQQELLEAIQEIHEQMREVYGSPRMHQELCDRGYEFSENTVAKLMKTAGIRAKTKKKFQATTDSKHSRPVAENHLNRQFDQATNVNEIWLSDITYIWTEEGWMYLAAVLDLSSRKVVGWSLAKRMTTDLVVNALQMAIAHESLSDAQLQQLMIHSDRGSQYASEAYQEQLTSRGITCSMSRKGNCWDNAPMESFFATLKKELVHHERYTTRSAARASLFEYIEVFYNRIRKHSALGYLSPAQFALAT